MANTYEVAPSADQRPYDGVRWIQVFNADAQDIPAGGLVAIIDHDADGIALVTAPTADSQVGLLINSPVVIAQGEYGQAHNDWPSSVLFEAGDGTPAAGDEWGVIAGGCKLRLGKTGYVFTGVGVDQYGVVQPTSYIAPASATGLTVETDNSSIVVGSVVTVQFSHGNFTLTNPSPGVVLVAASGGGGGSMSVSGSVHTGPYTGSTITVDESLGLVVGTGPALSITAASATTPGVVTTVAQTFGGSKTILTAEGTSQQWGFTCTTGKFASFSWEPITGSQTALTLSLWDGRDELYFVVAGDPFVGNPKGFFFDCPISPQTYTLSVRDANGRVAPGVSGVDAAGSQFTKGLCTQLGLAAPPILGPMPAPQPVIPVAPIPVAPPPTTFTATPGTGGNLVLGTIYYYTLWVATASGIQQVGAQVSGTPSGGNQTIVLNWTPIPGATGYTIYRSLTSGSLFGVLASVNANVLSFNDVGTVAPGQPPPGAVPISGPPLIPNPIKGRLPLAPPAPPGKFAPLLRGGRGDIDANGTVARVQGQPVSATPPAVGQVQQWNGTTWVPVAPGSIVSAATLDCCSLAGTSQSVPNNSPTALTWNANNYDTNGLHSTTANTSRVTIKTAGKYRISVFVQWLQNTTGLRSMTLYKNGVGSATISGATANAAASASPMFLLIAADISLVVGDYLEVYGLQTSGGPLAVIPEYFNAAWFSA